MPTYVCNARDGRLTNTQKRNVAEAITQIHHEVTGAPRSFVQVFFRSVMSGDHFIGGRPAPEDQVWVAGGIRAGRSAEQKRELVQRIMRACAQITGARESHVWVSVQDVEPAAMVEFGQVLSEPGDEAEWVKSLPAEVQEELRGLGEHPRRQRLLRPVHPGWEVPESFFEPLPDDRLDVFEGK